jgi:hypothetical protein
MPDESSHEPAPEKNAKPAEASLLQFLSGMAMQSLMHLGAMQNPITGKTEADLVNAKYSIDLLAILEEKTRGNLTDEEARYLRVALTDLRMRYVQVSDQGKEKPC